MRVRYQYEELVEATVREFCDAALAGERLPEEVVYRVSEQPMCDAFSDEIWCCIEAERGDVCLSFDVFRSAWFTPGTVEPPAPYVEGLEGTRTQEDDEGNESTFVWTPATGRWVLREE